MTAKTRILSTVARVTLALLIVAAMGILPAGRALASPDRITAAVDSASPVCKAVSEKIFSYGEPGREEVKSSRLLIDELRRLGFTVKGDLPVPADLVKDGISRTAFVAEMKGKEGGPTITIMLEYDALSNGHSCGHNLIATSGLLAAAGLAKVMPEIRGRLLVVGTPDEERGSLGGGKVALLEGGHFKGSDAVLITHPADRWSLDQRLLAMKRVFFTFKGKAAHAAAAPHKGISALDGVILTFNGVDMLREHVRQDVRMHGIVTKGGDRVNVVPELAQAEFAVRALDTATAEDAYRKIINCARGAELATGTKLEVKESRVSLTAPVRIPSLLALLGQKLQSLGVPKEEMKDQEEFASSDLGNVGYLFPTVNLWFRIAPEGTALHSDAFRDYAASDEAWRATVTAGKAIALTAYELFTKPEALKKVQKEFAEGKAREGRKP